MQTKNPADYKGVPQTVACSKRITSEKLEGAEPKTKQLANLFDKDHEARM